jgi:RNA polymerase sigma factor (sigma-70 family)
MVDSESSATIELEEYSDYDLLEIMTWKDDCLKEAQNAWRQFYERHYSFMLFVAHKKLANFYEKESIVDVVTDLFIKIYEKAAQTFKSEGETNKKNIRKHVRSWMSKILNNMLYDLQQGKTFEEVELPDEISESPKRTEMPSQVILNIKKFIEENLDDREKAILSLHFEFYDCTTPKRQIPTEALDKICHEYGIERANFRKIKSRAIKKIKENFNGRF